VPARDAAFRGETIRLVVGFAPGGGYDLHARVTADHLGRHLPGSPAVVVENMTGAGGLIAANYLARQARPDGLTIGFFGLGLVLPQLLGRPGVQFDAREYAFIGAPTFEDIDVCLSTRDSGVDLAAWRKESVRRRIGVTTSGSASHARSALTAAALGLPARMVIGYDGTTSMRLALDGGEVDVLCVGLLAYRTMFEPSGTYRAVVQVGGEDPLLKQQGVPSAEAIVHEERGRFLLGMLSALRTLDRFYLAPPGTPEGLVTVLRAAFEETMRDKEFLLAAHRAGLEIRPLNFQEIAARIGNVVSLPQSARHEVAALLAAEPR
jgi:tripartite-type tricarboxylate transporter receptor subunit TctC